MYSHCIRRSLPFVSADIFCRQLHKINHRYLTTVARVFEKKEAREQLTLSEWLNKLHNKTVSPLREKVEDEYLRSALGTEDKIIIYPTTSSLWQGATTAKDRLCELLKQCGTVDAEDLDDEKHKYLIDEFLEKSMLMSTESLVDVLRHFVDIRKSSKNGINEVKLIKAIETMLLRRYLRKSKFSMVEFESAFQISQIIIDLNRAKHSDFITALIEKLANDEHLASMSTSEFCSFMFLVTSNRKKLPHSQQLCIELKILSELSNLSSRQCALICAAFFKTQMKFFAIDLVESIIDFVLKSNDLFTPENHIGLSCILKCVGNCYTINKNLVDKLLDKCLSHKESMAITTIAHMCSVLTRQMHYRCDVLEFSINRLLQDLSNARIKDIERVFNCAAYFSHPAKLSKEHFNEIENAIVLAMNSQRQFFHHFLMTLLHLRTLGYSSLPLIDFVFGEKLKLVTEGYYQNIRAHLAVHSSLLLEAPQLYKNVVSPRKVLEMERKIEFIDFANIKVNEKSALIFRKWLKFLNSQFPKRVRTGKAFPFLHYPDIFIFDNDKLAQEFIINDYNRTSKSVKGVSCVVLLYKQVFADRFHYRIRGIHSLKIRLLRELGYNVYCIPFYARQVDDKKNIETFRIQENNRTQFSKQFYFCPSTS